MNVMRRSPSYTEVSSILMNAKSLGILPTPHKDKTFKCHDCDAMAVEYDHRDYNFPLLVVPVCHSCNMKRGAGIPIDSVANKLYNEEMMLLRRWNREEFDRLHRLAMLAIKRKIKSWKRVSHILKKDKARK